MKFEERSVYIIQRVSLKHVGIRTDFFSVRMQAPMLCTKRSENSWSNSMNVRIDPSLCWSTHLEFYQIAGKSGFGFSAITRGFHATSAWHGD
jgi:hypothetical protein